VRRPWFQWTGQEQFEDLFQRSPLAIRSGSTRAFLEETLEYFSSSVWTFAMGQFERVWNHGEPRGKAWRRDTVPQTASTGQQRLPFRWEHIDFGTVGPKLAVQGTRGVPSVEKRAEECTAAWARGSLKRMRLLLRAGEVGERCLETKIRGSGRFGVMIQTGRCRQPGTPYGGKTGSRRTTFTCFLDKARTRATVGEGPSRLPARGPVCGLRCRRKRNRQKI